MAQEHAILFEYEEDVVFAPGLCERERGEARPLSGLALQQSGLQRAHDTLHDVYQTTVQPNEMSRSFSFHKLKDGR